PRRHRRRHRARPRWRRGALDEHRSHVPRPRRLHRPPRSRNLFGRVIQREGTGMRTLFISAAALLAAACVGDRAELGGVDNRLTPPPAARACNLDDLRILQRGTLEFPEDAMTFVYISQQAFSLSQGKIRYDITEAGLP